MCAIFGAALHRLTGEKDINRVNFIMNYICASSVERGRDGFGFECWEHGSSYIEKDTGKLTTETYQDRQFFWGGDSPALIGNLRAEPTTEFVKEKMPADQQPYLSGNWSIVHNGTIANDKDLRTNSVETAIDSAAIAEILDGGTGPFHFQDQITKLKGSYAILAVDSRSRDNSIYFACNYRPIWYIETEYGVFFASSRSYFPPEYSPLMVEPYSVGKFTAVGGKIICEGGTLLPAGAANKALVVCSGGLDSVVAASYTQSRLGMDVTLFISFMEAAHKARRLSPSRRLRNTWAFRWCCFHSQFIPRQTPRCWIRTVRLLEVRKVPSSLTNGFQRETCYY